MNSGKKVGLFIHLGYPHLWPEFEAAIQALTATSLELTIYLTHQQLAEELLTTIQQTYPQIHLISASRGMDIGAFLLAVKQALAEGAEFDYLLKLHSKRDNYWRRMLISTCTSTPTQIQHILHLFDTQPQVGIVTAREYLYGMDHYNTSILYPMAQQWGIPLSQMQWNFPAGTMFWMRWSILKNFLSRISLDLQAEHDSFQLGYQGNPPATRVHSWERIFGIISLHQGFTNVGTDLVDLANFSWTQYLANYPDLTQAGYRTKGAAIYHYLKYGQAEGRTDQLRNP